MAADLIVVGGGAAGLGAARSARSKGASVVLIERSRIGGDCTFTGCVPSKALIEASLRGEEFVASMADAARAVESIATAESSAVLRAEGVEVLEGMARFVDRRTVEVDGRLVRGGSFVIATGAKATLPPISGLDEVEYLTNETIFEIEALPASLIALGGGPLGVELAQALARLGSEVTVVEAEPRLLPREEPLASAIVAGAVEACGVSVRVGSSVERVERTPDGVRARLSVGPPIEAAALLVAVGRTPATAELSLEAAGVRTDRGGRVVVDRRLRTSARGIYAAGDVALPLQFTHVAYATGRIAALNALSRLPLRSFDSAAVPRVTFTTPEVARVGLTEAEAVGHGGRVAFLPLAELDRAVIVGQTDGFVKIIVGPRPILRGLAGGRVLGATIVAPRAGEMIHELVLAMRARMFPARLAQATHAYPTWSMAVQQAAAQFFGEYGGRSARAARADALDADRRQPVGPAAS